MQAKGSINKVSRSVLLLTTCLTAQGWGKAPAPLWGPPQKGAVAADTTEASQAGAEILRRGGNAVDAAVAAALALGVASPAGSGLGGGGFAVVWRASDKKAYVLDFREVAPKAATRDMFVVSGKADPLKSRLGGLAVAVPGEPAGLAELEAKYGKLGLRQAVKPAVKLARSGFVVGRRLAEEAEEERKEGSVPEGLRALFEIKAGDRLARPELARTLELFGQTGKDALYKGAIAKQIIDAVKSSGGVLTEQDLADYRPIWRAPLTGHFRGYELWGVPPPAGGVTAIEALQILDALPVPAPEDRGSSAFLHRLAEAFKHAFADRARVLGDPAFVDVPTAHLIDPAYAKSRAQAIQDGRVLKPAEYGDKNVAAQPAEARDHGTSHVCAADGEGNVVALTTTINLEFGSHLVAGKSGILLNDQMDDFSAQPAEPNAFGLIGGFANAIAPGKRPLSSMTPLILVKDGKPFMCVGASGGPRIVTSTVQTIVNAVDFGLDAEAADASPRIHAQWMPDEVRVEPEIARDVRENLTKRGQKLQPTDMSGAVQTIILRRDHLEAASDPRKGGVPAAP